MTKKIIITFLTAILLVSTVTACSQNDDNQTTQENTKEITLEEQSVPQDIADAVLAKIDFPSAVSKTIDEINNYIDLDTEIIYQLSYYICGSGAYPDELLILKLTDKSYSNDVKKAVQKRLDSQIESYKDYAPDEMYKLDNAVVSVKDNWVFYYAADDSDVITDIINSYFK